MNYHQWQSTDAIRALQWGRFERLLNHAFVRSPFYRRRFNEIGLEAADIRSLDDLQQIPITWREDLRDSQELIADGYDVTTLFSSMTSGSTGRRTVTYFDRRGWLIAKYLLKLRARWACGVRPWDRIALFQEGSGESSWLRQQVLRQHKYPIDTRFAEWFPDVARFAPTVLYGFPGHLSRLAEFQNGALEPKAIFSSGEMLDKSTRRAIETGFGAPLYDIYGSTELKEIAWQCPERDAYHVNADWVVLECVDAKILVTSLYNYGMPLLRYEVGDTGQLLEASCVCGRGLPLMTPQLGRSVDYFVLPNGETVAPYTMTCAVEHVLGVRQYQIVQETVNRVVMNVVPDDDFDTAESREIVLALSAVLPGVEVRVDLLKCIQAQPSGKFRIVHSNIDGG